MKKLFLLALLFLIGARTQAESWTHYDTLQVGNANARVFVWVPEGAHRLRGLLVATDVFAEPDFLQDSVLRATLSQQRFGIVFVRGALALMNRGSREFDSTLNEHRHFNRLFERLGTTLAHPEIPQLPFLVFGHSTAGIFARNFAFTYPKRTIAVVLFKSGNFVPPPAYAATDFYNIPFMALSGEREEVLPYFNRQWNVLADTMTIRRGQGHLGHLFVEPGASHYHWDTASARYVALFYRKAIERKMGPAWYTPALPVRLNYILEESGWLTDTALATPPTFPAAHYSRYTGSPQAAYWHLDSQMAQAWQDFHYGRMAKVKDSIYFSGSSFDNGGRAMLANRRLGENNNQTTVTATALSGLPVKFLVTRGPGATDGSNVIRFLPGQWASNNNRVELLAYTEGDATRSPAMKGARIQLDAKGGTANSITFTALSNHIVTDGGFQLTASTSSGLPVEFEVLAGPAQIDPAGFLSYKPFVGGAATVVVRAAQPGDASFATATPVDRSFTLYALSAGDWDTLCLNAGPQVLSSFPASGTWSGPGVSTNGVFTPATAGVGTHTLTFSATIGGFNGSVQKQISVLAPPSDQLQILSGARLQADGGPESRYFWFKNGTWLEGETSNTLSVTSADLYNAHIWTGSCLVITQNQFLDPLGLGKRLGAGSLRLYPNPASEFVEIERPATVSAGGTLYLRSLNGQEVRKIIPSEEGNTRLSLQGIPAGLYQVEYRSPQGERWHSLLAKP